MPPSIKAERADAALGSFDPSETDRRGGSIKNPPATVRGRAQPLAAIDIEKSSSSQLRLSLTEWRGQLCVDIRDCTATVPGCFWPTSMGGMLDARHLPGLIEALAKLDSKANGTRTQAREATGKRLTSARASRRPPGGTIHDERQIDLVDYLRADKAT
jgi:hypothetical protein